MPPALAGKIALVTGASRGIGRETALALSRGGAHIVALARTVGGLEELDDAIRTAGGVATLVPLDLTDYDGIDRLAAALGERHGRLDILVGNAGILGPLSPLDHVPPLDWNGVFDINVTANYRLIRAFTGLLKQSAAGRAVFMTSAAVHLARAYWGPYASAKAAMETLARAFAAETINTSVRVNLMQPGLTRTNMLRTAFPQMDMDAVTTPERVADAIVQMCLPSVTETGKIYDLQQGRFLDFRAPG